MSRRHLAVGTFDRESALPGSGALWPVPFSKVTPSNGATMALLARLEPR